MKKFFSRLQFALLACASLFVMASCGSDDETSVDLSGETKEFLNGDMVLYTKAELAGVDKTLLPTGCPAIFNFDWVNKVDPNNSAANIVKLKMVNFQVGSMPMTATFECDAQTVTLDRWDQDEYKGKGWVKLQGLKNGRITINDGQSWQSTMGDITGYYNINTHEINCIIDFNFMSIKANILHQTIDKSNLEKYKQLKEQYEIDLEKWKEEHGIVDPTPDPKKFLNGRIVLYSRVEMNGEDKTLLPTGCPIIFDFDWKNRLDPAHTADNIVKVKMEDFKIGSMPMTASFECDVEIAKLTDQEKEQYKGSGWVKLQGMSNGVISMNGTPMPSTKGNIVGFYNAKTHDIVYDIDFKMMDIKAFILRQIIDKANLEKYAELKKKYEEDLAKWKEEHGK